jgi:pimeloyl-ACP methyl ester carboxylesterase
MSRRSPGLRLHSRSARPGVRLARLPAFLVAAALAVAAPATAQQVAGEISRDTLTGRLAELRRIHTPEGIEAVEPVEVNGSRQWISIRGLNRANPVLLVLHGGPGSPMMGMAWAYQKPWEDFFTVVNWDQRGVGKSFSAADSARLGRTLSPEQLARDAAVVVQHLRRRLGERKMVVLAYSYGTVFGPLLVQRHPEWFAAYVGMGQVSGEVNERELYDSLMARVRAAHDTTAIRELTALQPYPPPRGAPALEKLVAVRRWALRYDGGWYGKPDFALYYALPQWGPEYTAREAAEVDPAMAWAGEHLVDGPGGLRLPVVEEFAVPVVILQGRYDLLTPYSGAREYFDRIRAPSKRFVTFERSAHMIMLEEPGRFLMTLVNVVLPLAGGSPEFAPR